MLALSAVTSLTNTVIIALSLFFPPVETAITAFCSAGGVAILRLHQHSFQFLKWDVQRRKDIS